jgi:hypothetical protein
MAGGSCFAFQEVDGRRLPCLRLCLQGKLLIRNYFAEVGQVSLDFGDRVWPGAWTRVRYSGGILSFCFGESDG